MSHPEEHPDGWRKATSDDVDSADPSMTGNWYCTHDGCGASPAQLIASVCCGYQGAGACLHHLPKYLGRKVT